MSFQVYDEQRNVMSAINDTQIEPDSGQNNPYRTGSEQGTYTIRVVFGRQPLRPPANTIYTANLTKVMIGYRIYYSNDPDDLPGKVDLPAVTLNGRVLSTCPPRPIIRPEELTVWGRLDKSDWAGAVPASVKGASNPPNWVLSVTNRFTPYYPSADNSYMSAYISRMYLRPPYNNDMVVFRFRAPSFANTHEGEAPYRALQDKQVRFWSVCQDEPTNHYRGRPVHSRQPSPHSGRLRHVCHLGSVQTAQPRIAGRAWSTLAALGRTPGQ